MSDDNQEFVIYGPGVKERVLAEINSDKRNKKLAVTVSHCTINHLGDWYHSILAKVWCTGHSNNFELMDSRDV